MSWSNISVTGFLSSCLQLSTLNQNPQSCRDQTLCNSPFLLPSNLIHAGNSTTWRKDRKMEKEKTLLTNNHFSLKNLKVREEGGGGGELSILNSRIVMMMCCCRLSPLPHGDDVLGIVWTCLPVAILSLCFGLQKLSLSLFFWSRLQKFCSGEKNQNIKQSYRPVPHAEPMWAAVENNSTSRKPPRFLLLSLLWTEIWEAGKECTRAWSWLSSKQISMRRQVCSHSCSCLQLFSLLSGAVFTMRYVVKQECWHEFTVPQVFPWSLSCLKCSNIAKAFLLQFVLCFVSCTQRRRRRKKIPPHIARKNSTSFAFGTRESISTLRVPALLSEKLRGKNESTVKAKAVFATFKWNTRFRWTEWSVEENVPLSSFMQMCIITPAFKKTEITQHWC